MHCIRLRGCGGKRLSNTCTSTKHLIASETAFAESAATGRTVPETDKVGAAAGEVTALADELIEPRSIEDAS